MNDAETLVLTLQADYESARAIGPWLAESLTALGVPQLERLGELELAVHELAINIVDHAYAGLGGATYEIAMVENAATVEVRFVDSGAAYVSVPGPVDGVPQVRGYGLMITEQLASSISYERVGEENRWTLVFS